MSWASAQIKSVAQVVTGSTPSKADKSNYGDVFPWVKPPELGTTTPITTSPEALSEAGAMKARLLPKDAVLVSCIGSIGRVGIAGTRLATNQQINAVICGPNLVPRFAMYWFMHSTDVLSAAANKAVVPILNKGNFEKLAIAVPPMAEQRRIVEILDQADALCKRAREADAKAAHILPALFLKMFGDPAINPMGWPTTDFFGVFDDVTAGHTKVQARDFQPSGAVPIVDQGQDYVAGYTDDTSIAHLGPLPVVVFGDHTRTFKYVDFPFALGADGVRVLSVKDGIDPLFAYWHSRMLELPSAGYSRHFKYLKEKQFMRPAANRQSDFAQAASETTKLTAAIGTAKTKGEKLFTLLLQRAFSGQLTTKWRVAHSQELLIEMQEQARLLNLSAPMTPSKLRHRQHRSTT